MSGIPPVEGGNGPAPAGRADSIRLLEAARAFEAMLLQMMLKEMRDAQLENGFFGGGTGAGVYEGMFERFLSERLAEDSPFGIADELLRRWSDDLDAAGEALRRLRQARGRELYLDAAIAENPETAVATQVPEAATDQVFRGAEEKKMKSGVRDGD